MYNKVSVLVPTRGRRERLEALLDSYYMTTAGCSNLWFRVDVDDVATVQMLVGFNVLVGPRFEGYRSLPTFFNELAAAADGDVLMVANDDMVFKTYGWDRLILEAASDYPDGIFDFGVTTHNPLNFPIATVSKKLVETLGFLYDPRIFWGDLFLRDVMAAFGRAIPLPEVEIAHDWAGFSPDGVFMEGDGVRRHGWMKHHQRAVDEAVVKLSEDPAIMRLREVRA